MMWLLAVVLFVTTSTKSFTGACAVDPPCDCPFEDEAICSNMGLTKFPVFHNTSVPVRRIKLTGNLFRRIEAFAFVNVTFADHVEIVLDNNSIEFIADMALDGLQNKSVFLQMLDTNLLKLPKALMILDRIKTLVVDCDLDPEVMKKLGLSLTGLGYKSFSGWPFGLRYARHVSSLQVWSHNLTELPPDAFLGLENSLRTLFLYEGNLSRSPDALCRLQHLTALQFTNTTFATGELSIPNCQQSMPSLRTLALYGVALPKVPPVSTVFRSLRSLSLTKAQLESFSSDKLPYSVQSLDLSGNRFTTIPFGISKLANLTALYLNDNQITSLTAQSFGDLKMLALIELSGNPISSVEDDTFKTTPDLRALNLMDANLTTVPRSLRYLKKTDINLNRNRIQCSCDLAWMLSWKAFTTGDAQIRGSCFPSDFGLSSFVLARLRECQVGPVGR